MGLILKKRREALFYGFDGVDSALPAGWLPYGDHESDEGTQHQSCAQGQCRHRELQKFELLKQ